MATRTVTQVVCDRCNREMKAKEGAAEPTTPEPVLYLSRPGAEDISFTDLCKKCTKRVAALVDDIGPLTFKAKSDEDNGAEGEDDVEASVDDDEDDEDEDDDDQGVDTSAAAAG